MKPFLKALCSIFSISFCISLVGMIILAIKKNSNWKYWGLIVLVSLVLFTFTNSIYSDLELVNQSSAQYTAGINYLKSGKYEQALSAFQQVIKEDKKHYADAQVKIAEVSELYAESLLQEAINLHEQGDYIGAWTKLKKCLEISPKNNEAMTLRVSYEKDKNTQGYKLKEEELEKLLQQVAEQDVDTALLQLKNYLAEDNPEDLKEKVKKPIRELEEKKYNEILHEVEKQDVETAINTLQKYLLAEHPNDLKQKISGLLSDYEGRFEKIKAEREFEAKTGVKVTSIETLWAWQTDIGGKRLLSPQIKITLKNVSKKDISSLYVKASFVNKQTKEVFGDGLDYIVSSVEAPLKSGYSKTARISADVGYTNDSIALNFPELSVDIYINDVFYKQVQVEKIYAGVRWQ